MALNPGPPLPTLGNTIGNTIGNAIGNTIGNAMSNAIGNTIGSARGNIRHRASGTRSVSGAPLLFLSSSQIWSCQFFCFKDSAGPAPNYSHDPFSDSFALFCPKYFFYNDLYQKGSHGTSQNTPETKKSSKNLASERTRGRAMQKGSVWKGLSSKSMAGVMF